MPLLRYRTKDLTVIKGDPCPCGRTHRRIERIKGRTDDMLIVKGVNMYPIQVERILMTFPEVANNYLIVLERENDVERMAVLAELRPDAFRGELAALEALRSRITAALRDELLVTPKVELVESGVIPESEGKAVRVEDRRE